MEDEKFAEQVKEIILYSTTKNTSSDNEDTNELIKSGSKTFTTLDGYKNRLTDDNKKILYSTDEVSQSTALNMWTCLLYTSPSPRDRTRSRMPSSA